MLLTGIQQAADLFGVAYETIRAWIDRGAPCAKMGAQFDAYEFESARLIAWYVQWKTAEQGEPAKDRVLRLQADEIELRLAEKRGTLIRADAIEPVIGAAIIAAREALLRTGRRLAVLMEGASASERERIITESHEEFLRLISQWRHGQRDSDDVPLNEGNERTA